MAVTDYAPLAFSAMAVTDFAPMALRAMGRGLYLRLGPSASKHSLH